MSKKEILLNLKRFDCPADLGGVNRLAPVDAWARKIVETVCPALNKYAAVANFSVFLPEAHLLSAGKVQQEILQLGCQGVAAGDIAPGKNFGAFTSEKPATVMRALGASTALIGHCEERNAKRTLLASVCDDKAKVEAALNSALAAEVVAALNAGLQVVYCIGESAEQQEARQQVLSAQLHTVLSALDNEILQERRLLLAYEPVWAIGPGKTPPDRAYIAEIAAFIKSLYPDVAVVYGGGLKVENAAMLKSIPDIDGGLIALTRFGGTDFGFYPDEYLEIVDTYLQA